MKASAGVLLASLAILAERVIPEKKELPETSGLKKEDPKTKKFNKASAKSRSKNKKIAGKKRKFSGRRNKK